MTNKLTKCEKKFLSPAVFYGWNIEVWNKGGNLTGYWDADRLLPVKIGPIATSLLDKGYLEHLEPARFISTIRATKKALELRCKNNHCREGKTIAVIEGVTTGMCPYCEYGILPESNNE